MIIKENKNSHSLVPSFKSRVFKFRVGVKSIFLLLIIAFLIIAGIISSSRLQKAGFSGIADFLKTVSTNYFNGMNANPEKISIEIKEKDFKLLEQHREVALKRDLIINNIDGEYVPATFEYQGKKMKVKLRLKGHMTDHLQNNKWSFRIKLEDNNSFFGMKKFSIQHPGTRGYVYEWIYHELMKREDIITLRYKFINVTVNGREWGIYAVEENFDKALIENNNRKKGPIVRFNPDLYWVDRYNELVHKKPVAEFANYYSANLEAFDEKNILGDSIQKAYFLKALALVDGLRSKKLSVDQVVDVERLAKFHAITDLVGGEHSLDWSDTKYYFNPVTEKLEPISYESFSDFPIRSLIGNYRYVELDSAIGNYEDWHTALFSNTVFFKAYVHQLERIAEPNYLNTFFNTINSELKNNLAILYKEFPYKKFDKQCYYQNQLMIKKILSAPQSFYAYYNNISNNQLHLQIGSIESLPIEIKYVSIGNTNFLPLHQIIIPPKTRNNFIKYKDYSFLLPDDIIWNNKLSASIEVHYSVLGASKVQKTAAFPYLHPENEYIASDLKNKVGNINEFPFLLIDEKSKSIIIKGEKCVINKDLIIPEGYTVFANPSLSINLINSAKIISYSPFVFKGGEDEIIIIETSDSTGQGLEFINSKTSVFEYVVFKNFPVINDKQWSRTAAVTFYESKVTFNNCTFYNSKAEHAVNIICSDFKFKECSFEKNHQSALKIEFSTGEINNAVFENCNSNAIDIIQSALKLNSVYINGAKNKAINIKDGSQMTCNDIRILNSKIAVSALNLNTVNIHKIAISNSAYGFVTYKNKQGYGYPSFNISELTLQNVKKNYLIESKSNIIVDNKQIIEETNNVESIIKGDNK